MLNISETGDSKKRSRIIILDSDPTEKSVGILVDDVYSVSTRHASDIERETDDKAHSTRFILGVIRITRSDKHNLVLWLDIQNIRASITSEL
ncbi:chemotaxis protein CheW [uncultured Methanospirillum sp.]|uniref:chemotaxis protein CheW n=1 Tax=uncultured Methanospirillum sp. TaxID=262503 RepID=UPI0029C88419|nr:chemotaxis protein CheW [uncultured Methanospirillum sp.]